MAILSRRTSQCPEVCTALHLRTLFHLWPWVSACGLRTVGTQGDRVATGSIKQHHLLPLNGHNTGEVLRLGIWFCRAMAYARHSGIADDAGRRMQRDY